MAEPTLTITIDRASLGKSPLVFSATDGVGQLGCGSFQKPGMVARVTYAPSPAYQHGEIPLAWSLQQGLLNWTAFPDVGTETEAQALYAEIWEAATQWPSYLVTTVEDDAPAETWTCYPGSVEPEARTRANLLDHDTVWAIALPCYPVSAVEPSTP